MRPGLVASFVSRGSRWFRTVGWLLGWVLTSGFVSANEPQQAPNILLLIADDLGWRDIGYHDSEIRTPHLDKLAAAGVRLERHYVYPTCSPTRAGLLTGRAPSRFGIYAPIDGRSTASLPREVPTLAKVLKERGYVTALFGKWHLGLRPEVGPRQFGFDQTYGYLHGQLDQLTHVYKNGDRTWHRNDQLLEEKGHATDLITEETIRFLSTKRTAPFFLYVAFSVPHVPLQEEDRWLAPYMESIPDPSRRAYAASITHLDDAVGRIVAALEKAGQRDKTLVLFTSDNGGQRDHRSTTDYGGKHGPYPTLGDNRPWRGWKGELYEGGIRVPALVSWPGRLQAGVLRETISCLDWFPTCASLAGARIDPSWQLEGRDVGPLLTGQERRPPLRTLYWRTPNAAAVLEGDWKLIVPQRRAADVELYHLAGDFAEKKNLAEENPAKVEALRKILGEQKQLDR
ncbi:MAG TPA: sulfatase-like hydrolase/transferase [Gemmataceae bacterium]|nr:sulfatase-like hydrolase/transferase [Gemmataceae bacterium]